MKSGEIFDVLEKEFGDLNQIDPTIFTAVLTNKLAKKEFIWLKSLREAVKTEIRRLDSIYEEYISFIEYLRLLPFFIAFCFMVVFFIKFFTGRMKSTLIGDFLKNMLEILSDNSIKLGDTLYWLVNLFLHPFFLSVMIYILVKLIYKMLKVDSLIHKIKKFIFRIKHPDYPVLLLLLDCINNAVEKKETIIVKGKSEDEEEDKYNVILIGLGKSPIDVLNIIRTEKFLDSKETLELLKSTPPIVGNQLSKQDAEKFADHLNKAGAEAIVDEDYEYE